MNCLKARRADSRLERIGKNESVTRLGELTGYLWKRRTREIREKREENKRKVDDMGACDIVNIFYK